jgi:hypothetical protein
VGAHQKYNRLDNLTFSGYGADKYSVGVGMFSRYISLRSRLVRAYEATFNATITISAYSFLGDTSVKLANHAQQRMIYPSIDSHTRHSETNSYVDNVGETN